MKCNITNCVSCNETSCFLCEFGYTLFNSLCHICPDNCQNCENPSQCSKCNDGFYIDSSQHCIKCSDNACSQCDYQDNCNICIVGYYLDLKDSKCLPCTSLCSECLSNSLCTKCEKGAYIDETTYKCLMCPSFCYDCKNFDFCVECSSNYLQKSEGNCIPCMHDCKKCESEDICLICEAGSYLDESKRCRKCSINCDSCNSYEICNECHIGYFLKEGYCIICSEINCLNCEKNLCTVCKAGFYLVKETDLCMNCIQNCISCNNSNSCLSCSEGFYLDSETNNCKNCIQNCLICSNSKDCLVCQNGFFLNEDNVSIKCRRCPNNCEECNLGDCLICYPGYYLNEVSKCIICGGNCLTCQFKGYCNQCIDGFYLDSAASCRSCPNYCAKCSEYDFCSECVSGYVLQSDSSCSICPKGCISCDDNKNCRICEVGYKLESNSCMKCSAISMPKALIASNFTTLTVEFASFIDVNQVNCNSVINTEDSFGTRWNCSYSQKTLFIHFDNDYLFGDSSNIFVANDALFNRPCLSGMIYNFTAKFSNTPPIPTAIIKGTPLASLACLDGDIEYNLDAVRGTVNILPRVKWSAVQTPEDHSVSEYFLGLNGTRITIPIRLFKKIDSNLVVFAEIMNSLKKSSIASFTTQLIGEKRMTVLIDAGTEINLTTSKECTLNVKIENDCGADKEINIEWSLTATDNPSDKYSLQQIQTSVPHKLKIEANTLDPFYFYTYTARAKSGSLTGYASIKIYGVAEELVIVLNKKSGNISPALDLIIDASHSYDPNYIDSKLEFTWICIDQLTSKPCQGADNFPLIYSEFSSILSIPAGRLPAGKSIKIILTVENSYDSRKAEDSLVFFIYKGLSTNIQMSFAPKKILSSSSLHLSAVIISDANYILKWTQDLGSPVEILPDYMHSISFLPYTFKEGEFYKFTLKATETLNGSFATSSVEFRVNVPADCLSNLTINPWNGVALRDYFTLSIDSCSDGDEEDNILTYTFFTIPTDFTRLFINKPQQFSKVSFLMYEGYFYAGVRVCDYILGCTVKFLDSQFYVSSYSGRRLESDPVLIYSNMISMNSDSAIIYGILVMNTFNMSIDQIDIVFDQSKSSAYEERIDSDSIEMMIKLVLQTIINQGQNLNLAKTSEYLDDILAIINNSTCELSIEIMDDLRLLSSLVYDLFGSNMECVLIINNFLDQVFKVYSENILPGNVVASFGSSDISYYKFREVSQNYTDKKIDVDNISVFIESLPFNKTDLIDINIKTFPDIENFSDMIDLTFTKSGTYQNQIISKTEETVIPLTTPTVILFFQAQKNKTGIWVCQHYSQGIWISERCEMLQEKKGIIMVRISHSSLFRIYDSYLIPATSEPANFEYFGPVIIIGLLTLILVIGYTIFNILEKHDVKKIRQVTVDVSDIKGGDIFENIESKENRVTVIETVRKSSMSCFSHHLIFGIFSYDKFLPRGYRILLICLILSTQFTLEGTMILFMKWNLGWTQTMATVASIAVTLTIPLHVIFNLTLRRFSGRLCRIICYIAYFWCIANGVLSFLITIYIVDRHTIWVLSFILGLAFEVIIQFIFMVLRRKIQKIKLEE